MKFREEFAFLICLSAILLAVEAQGGNKVQSNQYGDYSDYGSPDYGNPKPPPVVDHRLACYSCMYEEEDGEEIQGTTNCNEPFKSFQVPEVMCNGSCSMNFRWHVKPTHFTINRNCLPRCRERETELSHTKCCSTKLCNGFTSSIEQVKFNVCLTLLLAFIVLVDVAKVFS
jgi:hypothetical protein